MTTAPSRNDSTTFKPRVRRLGSGHYLVESATRPGVGHPVTADRCNCTGFSYRGICRHVKLVQAIEPAFEAWYGQRAAREATEKAQRAVARPAGLAALQEAFGV